MRKWGVAMGILAAMLAAGSAFAEVFVVGPGMLGHPADDPSVGYSALELDLDTVYPGAEYAFAPGKAGVPLRPWEDAWYQLSQMPGV